MDKLFIGNYKELARTFPVTVLDGHDLQIEALEAYFMTVKRCMDADDRVGVYESLQAALDTIETFKLYNSKDENDPLR